MCVGKFDLNLNINLQVFVCLACLFLTGCSCNKLFFYPQEKILQTPAKGGLAYENVKVTTKDDIILHNWLIKPDGEVKGRILFLHGNAENISTHIRSVYWLPQVGYEVLLMEYRGYGQSTGEPCLPKILLDIEASFDWLKRRNDTNVPLYIFGQSLGASLASYAVGAHPEWTVAGVILDAPFFSYREIARDKLSNLWLTWPLQYPLSLLVSDNFSPIDNVDRISPRPLLMFYSNNDRIIPAYHSRKLFEQAKEPKKRILTNEQHIATFLKAEYRNRLLEFLDSTY